MAKLAAIQKAVNKFVGVTTLAEIANNCIDPVRAFNAKDKDCAADARLRSAKEQRGENQREFNKARILRAEAYARYIDEVDSGNRMGDYPPITFWCKEDAQYADNVLILPGSAIITAVDGETQLAARFMLAAQDGAWFDKPFEFKLTTSSTKEAAMQTLHDMNHFATPVSEKETAALNVEGALTKAINAGKDASGINPNAVKVRGDKATGDYSTTGLILLHGAIGALNGPEALVKTVPSQISRFNGQFVELNGGAARVSNFIKDVTSLPHNVLKGITCDHMLALGVRFCEAGHLASPLSPSVYAMLVKTMKEERGGSYAKAHIAARTLVTALSA